MSDCGLRIADFGFRISDVGIRLERLREMDKPELKRRVKEFALRVMKLVDALPNTTAGRAIANQLVRSGTSTGANYRAACRGRSKAEFIAKIGNVEEEVDESAWWLEIIIEGNLLPETVAGPLLREAEELTAIFTAIGRTARQNNLKARELTSATPKSEIRNPT